VHTEANITVDRDLTIRGQGAPNTTVQANISAGSGVGHVFVVDAGIAATIRDMTIRYGSDAVGAGISNSGTLNINNAMITENAAGNNPGGGIFNAGVLFLTDSTVSSNSAKYGGGIASGGPVTVRNSTLSGNTAGNSPSPGGGGIYSGGTGAAVTMSNSTVSDNSAPVGAGLANDANATGPMHIKNSIVARSTSGSDCFNAAIFLADGANLDTDGSCVAAAGSINVAQVTSSQLNLGPLSLNAPGATETHALLSGSVAIDAATDCTDLFFDPVTTDQRGVSRPQGIACDIGAYEREPTVPTSKVNVRFHYAANGSAGGWSATKTVTQSGSVTIGPQAMGGNLIVQPGNTLRVGYDFTMPGSHPTTMLVFTQTLVTFQALCASGSGGGTIVFSIPNQSYTDPQNSSAWYPSGNQQDPSVYQGSLTVPDLCGGGALSLRQGATFSATVGSM
jgi:predicted outer membrane repeat protein